MVRQGWAGWGTLAPWLAGDTVRPWGWACCLLVCVSAQGKVAACLCTPPPSLWYGPELWSP